MEYTWSVLFWFYFIYSFMGWCIEVCYAALQNRKFVNRGFINLPLCPIYGTSAVLFALFLPELKDNLFFLFLGGMVLATLVEYITGRELEKIFSKKLWDYSNIRWNLDGYICLRYSVFWGILALIIMLFINPFLIWLLNLLPGLLTLIVLWIFAILLLTDFAGTSLAVLGMKKEAARFAHFTENVQHTSKLLENALTRRIQTRMVKSFPSITIEALGVKKSVSKSSVFAKGYSFYKIVSLFFIGAFLGDITETIFCYITTGRLMSRSSVVYGPFSIVWGLGCALLTALLYRYKDRSDRYIFMMGTILGGAYEYICSVFTEMVFGTIFWDYSGFSFNLGGRINLLYCFFWGIAAVVWLKSIYPFLSKWIQKISKRAGTIGCNLMILFMVFNILISSLALGRYTQRNSDSTPDQQTNTGTSVSRYLDEKFPDERMERIYPNVKIVD